MACERYPDPAIQILDPRFQKYHLYADAVERLATGMRWAEGPVWSSYYPKQALGAAFTP